MARRNSVLGPRTSKPCHGCGEKWERPAEGVCHKCRTLLEKGKRYDAMAISVTETVSCAKPRRINYFEAEREPFTSEEPARDRLGAAMNELIRLASVPGSATLTDCEVLIPNQNIAFYDRDVVIINAKFFEVLNKIDSSIRDCINETNKISRESGSNLLLQLASGRMTVDDFNNKTIGKKE